MASDFSTDSSAPVAYTVSVLMPVYNCAPFLVEAIQSVLEQTYPSFELVIVDDGSTDSTPAILVEFASRDSRIKVITQKNAGPGAAMNTGLSACSRDWVFVMHGDDIMLPCRLEKQLQFIAENPCIALAGSYVLLIDTKGRVIGEGKSAYTDLRLVEEARRDKKIIGGLYHVAFSRKIALEIGGYRTNMIVNEDVDFYNRLIDAGYTFRVQPEFLMKYRVHSGSASVSKTLLVRSHWRYLKDEITRRRSGMPGRTYEEYTLMEKRKPWPFRMNIVRKDMAKAYYKKATLHFSAGNYIACLMDAAMAVTLQPLLTLAQIVRKKPFSAHRNSAQ